MVPNGHLERAGDTPVARITGYTRQEERRRVYAKLAGISQSASDLSRRSTARIAHSHQLPFTGNLPGENPCLDILDW